jgi:hypothetical protein
VPELYGRRYSVEQLRQRIGRVGQVAGIRACTLSDGPEDGVRALEFYTGSGLRFTVLPDRGMDIGPAEWRGAPLAWASAAAIRHPAFYEAEGPGWLRGFAGGLLVTCGPSNVGPASEDAGERFGLHGRASHTPASQVGYVAGWEGQEYWLRAWGAVREARLFGENIALTRTISARLGGDEIWIEDRIVNEGFEETPLQILYHINLGFPLLDEGSELLVDSTLTPRDAQAAAGQAQALRGAAPAPGFREQVFHHQVRPAADGWATVALVNRAFDGRGLGLRLRYRPEELPHLWQWRMLGQGAYVMGIEPANCGLAGRAEERRMGRLAILAPGEERVHRLELGVLASAEAIAEAAAAI